MPSVKIMRKAGFFWPGNACGEAVFGGRLDLSVAVSGKSREYVQKWGI